MLDLNQALKLFSFIPPLYGYLLSRFSNVEVTPDNGIGKQVFYSEKKKNFFIKHNFFVKTYTDISLVNVAVIYCKTERPVLKKIVNIEGEAQNLNGNYELNTTYNLSAGKLNKLFISTTFLCDDWESDTGPVDLKLTYSIPNIPGLKTKTYNFSLGQDGVLTPEETQKKRIN